MAVTLQEVGRRAGVSAMTVSRVINGRPGVDAETQRRVEEVIAELDYVPNRIARGLLSQKTQTIGLIVPDVVNPFFAPVVRGAETAARRAGYRVLLCNSEGDLRLEREYIEDLVAHRVEGLLLAPASDSSRHSVFPLLRGGFPLVLLDRVLPDSDCDLVVSDSATGARRLVEHLLAVGHRDIAHLTDAEDTSTGRDRLQGYREALAAAGLPVREDLVFRTTVDQIGGYRAAQEALALEPRPTAIFAVNNMTAVGAMKALRERNFGSRRHGPRLLRRRRAPRRALSVPHGRRSACRDAGSLGAQLLLERIAGKAGDRSRRITLQTDLIVRLSCCSTSGVPQR